MKRSIIMSLLVISAAVTLVGAGTWATFSDTEKSEDNTISTGSLNLLVGTTPGGILNCDYDDDPFASPFFNISNAAPGDSYEVTICVWNDGSIDGTLDGDAHDLTDVEVGDCNQPEELAEGTATCADGNDGELSENVTVNIWVDGDCDNVNDDALLDTNWENGDLWFFSGDMDALDAFPFPQGDMNAGSSWCYGIEATVNVTAGNEIQTDKVTIDLTFTLTQD